jgi:hypothetical protein
MLLGVFACSVFDKLADRARHGDPRARAPSLPTASESPVERRRRQNRESQERFQDRQERGVALFPLELPEHDVAAYFIRTGKLSPEAALDRKAIMRALERMVGEIVSA